MVGALGIAKDGFRDLSPVQRRPAASDCEQVGVGSGHLREICHHLLICIERGLRAHKVDAGRILGRRSSAAGAADESGDSFFEEPVLPAADAVDSVPEVPDPEEGLTAAESRAVRVPAEEDVVSMDPDPEFVAAVFPQPARSARAEQRARTVLPACFIFFMRVSFMSVTESVSFFHRAILVSSDMRYVCKVKLAFIVSIISR